MKKYFNYSQICNHLLKDLPLRTKDILERRFGLKTEKRETLESIGKKYRVTRERIRQIEKNGLCKISPKLKTFQKIFQYFNEQLVNYGKLKKEDLFLNSLSGPEFHNHILFLLNLERGFERFNENDELHSFWTIEQSSVSLAQQVINFILDEFEKRAQPLAFEEIFEIYSRKTDKEVQLTSNILLSYIEISKQISRGPEGQFGLRHWPEINPRGIRDKAYLVLKREKRPLHFTEIARFINNLSSSVHNELIRDSKFILVGRGIYALSEWGYKQGTVKEVILDILYNEKRPLTKEEIMKKVLEKRIVKPNTILLNLGDKEYFFKDSQGRYQIAYKKKIKIN